MFKVYICIFFAYNTPFEALTTYNICKLSTSCTCILGLIQGIRLVSLKNSTSNSPLRLSSVMWWGITSQELATHVWMQQLCLHVPACLQWLLSGMKLWLFPPEKTLNGGEEESRKGFREGSLGQIWSTWSGWTGCGQESEHLTSIWRYIDNEETQVCIERRTFNNAPVFMFG